MAAWVDLSAIHNPAPGRRPPASWGDGVAANLELLRRPSGAYIATAQTTASSSYTDLSTVGPVVSLDTGAAVLVTLGCYMNSSVGGGFSAMGVAISGATTVAASDDFSHYVQEPAAGAVQHQQGITLYISGLTPGTNTFTAKYKATSGTSQFSRRHMSVTPLF